MISTRDRIEGGLLGLLVGDALGVPYEFHDPKRIPPAEEIEMDPPAGFRRSHPGVPPGTWSDDGAHALCLLSSLLDHGRLDLDDLGARLLAWWHQGLYVVDGGKPFDIGNQTSDALIAMENGAPARSAGGRGERDNGNGSLMRALPLALWHQGDDAALVADAAAQSLVTHGHPRAQACCALYCLWARRILQQHPRPWQDAVATAQASLSGPQAEELARVLAFEQPRGTGYVVDTLASARVALEAGPYEAVVKRAIAFGRDTDTTACVAGGLAGLRDGVGAIPTRWRDRLRGQAQVQPLLDRLRARA